MNNVTQQLFLPNAGVNQPSPPSPSSQTTVDMPVPALEVNLQDVRDFSNVCRTCATITELVIPIFSGQGLHYNLAEKINQHMPIQVAETDILPLVVCLQCSSQLLAWHELVNCCEQADQALRSKIAADTGTDIPAKDPKTTKPIPNPTTHEEPQNQAYLDIKGEENDADGSKVARWAEAPKTSTVGADGRRRAWCQPCNKSVAVVSWRRHLRLHNGERRYSCHSCGRAFADSGNLARHVRTLHAQERPFACPTCRKTFTRRAHLDDHTKSHSERREFICDVCGKGSKSGAALRMHVRTHGAPALHCAHCPRAFKRRAELRAHRSVHSGERPHACACGRAFRLRTQLNTHARTHS